MGFLRFLRFIGRAEATRESFRTIYAVHSREIAEHPEMLTEHRCRPSDLALYLTAEVHYKSRHWPYIPSSLWQDIAPFRVMGESDGPEALAELIAAREGFREVRLEWLAAKLRAVVDDAIANPSRPDGLFAMNPGFGSEWELLLTEDERAHLYMARGHYLNERLPMLDLHDRARQPPSPPSANDDDLPF